MSDQPAGRQGGDVRAAEWIRRIGRGDAAALEQLYRAWFDRILSVVISATGRDEAFGMDVVQDVMVKLIDRTPKVDSEAQLAAWMRRAALSAAINRIRRERRAAAREGRASGATAGGVVRVGGVGGAGVIIEAGDPSSAALDDERLAWIEGELAGLSGSDRDLVRRRVVDGSTLEAVGEGAGMTGDAVHGRLRRVMQGLRARAREMFR